MEESFSSTSSSSSTTGPPEPKAFEKAIGVRVELPGFGTGFGTGKAARQYEEALASQVQDAEIARSANATSAEVKVVKSK